MQVTYQVNRRKACDLCSLKKIKCDMLKPTCLNCQSFKAECRTTTVRKKVGASRTRKQQKSASPVTPAASETTINNSRIDNFESRLNQMEQRMDQVLQEMRTVSKNSSERADISSTTRVPQVSLPQQYVPDQNLLDFDYFNLDNVNQLLAQQPLDLNQPSEQELLPPVNLVTNETTTAVDSSYPSLPPLATIQPAIENYFAHTNSLLPLFSPTTFFRMLKDYYSFNCRSPRTVWAAVNVVLALATRLPASPSNDLDLASGDIQVAKYVNNAQSILVEIAGREVELLDLQVVIGLVIIFHLLKDSRPAVVLIGMAVRLAHRLRLHTREGSHSLSESETLERNRAFWITYLFDKDICLRWHTPSVQLDTDIYLDLPSEFPEDGAGNIHTKNGQLCINFFRYRTRLANIQGRIYDLLFATRSARISREERRGRIAILHNQLERWKQDLPPELQAELMVSHVSRAALFWLCLMHFSYLGCLVAIHGIWSFDAEWRKRLTTRVGTGSDLLAIADAPRTMPPLPPGWRKCVAMSRSCMKMMPQMHLSDCSVWATGCSYFSALLVLQANIFEHPLAEDVDSDLQLTNFAVCVLNKMSDASTVMAMKRMNVVASDLDRRASLFVEEARLSVTASEQAQLGSGSLGSENSNIQNPLGQASNVDLQWDWGNDGVEAWPLMDFSLNDKTTVPSRFDAFNIGLGPFEEWNAGGMEGLFDAGTFAEQVPFLETF